MTIDCPNAKVNVLNREIMDEFQSLITSVENDASISSVVLISGYTKIFWNYDVNFVFL